MSSSLTVAAFVAAAAVSLGASAVLVIRLERLPGPVDRTLRSVAGGPLSVVQASVGLHRRHTADPRRPAISQIRPGTQRDISKKTVCRGAAAGFGLKRRGPRAPTFTVAGLRLGAPAGQSAGVTLGSGGRTWSSV